MLPPQPLLNGSYKGSFIKDFLQQPQRKFSAAVDKNYSNHQAEALAAEIEAATNNAEAFEKIKAVGIAVSGSLLLLILLLIFKLESSLWRSAEALEERFAN